MDRKSLPVVVITLLFSTAAFAQWGPLTLARAGAVQIADASAQESAQIPSILRAPGSSAFVATPAVSGTGVINKVPKWQDTAGALMDSAISEAAGVLTLGTLAAKGEIRIAGAAVQDVFSGMGVDVNAGPAMNYGYAGASFGRSAGFFNVRPDASATGINPSLRFMTANVQRLVITKTGDVGIGTVAPAAKLDVQGDINVSGNINAKYQDLAEWVGSSSDLAPGTVVVLDSQHNDAVVASAHAYDTTVAGVVSARPGITLGEPGANREKIATTGRVRVYVDATRAPIRIGDLLVTSDISGTAMRSEPVSINGRAFHQPGTIIGKALEPLASGKGEILVLLTLQ
jgi:hypothetical protein